MGILQESLKMMKNSINYILRDQGHIMFKTTYKKEREKNIRTHYITTIKIDE